MFTGVREVRGLPILAAGAPPRFLTNLGDPAERQSEAGRAMPGLSCIREIPGGREGGERLRVKAILQTESRVPNSLQYFLTFVGRFAMITANNTTNKEKFAV